MSISNVKEAVQINENRIAEIVKGFGNEIIDTPSAAVLNVEGTPVRLLLAGIEIDWSVNPRSETADIVDIYEKTMDGYEKSEKGETGGARDNWIVNLKLTADTPAILINNHHSVTALKRVYEDDLAIEIDAEILPIRGQQNARILAAVSNRHGISMTDAENAVAVTQLLPLYEYNSSWAVFDGKPVLTLGTIGAMIGSHNKGKTGKLVPARSINSVSKDYRNWVFDKVITFEIKTDDPVDMLKLFMKFVDTAVKPAVKGLAEKFKTEVLEDRFDECEISEVEAFGNLVTERLKQIDMLVRRFEADEIEFQSHETSGKLNLKVNQTLLDTKASVLEYPRAGNKLLSADVCTQCHNFIRDTLNNVDAIVSSKIPTGSKQGASVGRRQESTENGESENEDDFAGMTKAELEKHLGKLKESLGLLEVEQERSDDVDNTDKIESTKAEIAEVEKRIGASQTTIAGTEQTGQKSTPTSKKSETLALSGDVAGVVNEFQSTVNEFANGFLKDSNNISEKEAKRIQLEVINKIDRVVNKVTASKDSELGKLKKFILECTALAGNILETKIK